MNRDIFLGEDLSQKCVFIFLFENDYKKYLYLLNILMKSNAKLPSEKYNNSLFWKTGSNDAVLLERFRSDPSFI